MIARCKYLFQFPLQTAPHHLLGGVLKNQSDIDPHREKNIGAVHASRNELREVKDRSSGGKPCARRPPPRQPPLPTRSPLPQQQQQRERQGGRGNVLPLSFPVQLAILAALAVAI